VGDTEITAAIAEVAGEIDGWSARLVGGDNGDAATIQIAGPHPFAFSPDLLKSPDYASSSTSTGRSRPCTRARARWWMPPGRRPRPGASTS